jgi:DNA-binding MarR family transcriptional regulator
MGKTDFNRIIHEPVRLQIITYLAAGTKRSCSFSELQEKLGLSSGNLSVQLRRLGEAGYISVTKKFKNRRPLTSVSLTPGGMEALQEYIAGLESIVRRFKDDSPRDGP